MSDGPAPTGTDHDIDGTPRTSASSAQWRLDLGRSLLLADVLTYSAGWALLFCVYLVHRSELGLLAVLAVSGARVVPSILDGPPIRWIMSHSPSQSAMAACSVVGALLVGTLLVPDKPHLWQSCLVVAAVASFCGDLFDELAVQQFRGPEPPIARITGVWASPRRFRLLRAPLVGLPTAFAAAGSTSTAFLVLSSYLAIAALLVGLATKPTTSRAPPGELG